MFYGSQYRVHKMRRPKSCEKKSCPGGRGRWCGTSGGDRGDSGIQAANEGLLKASSKSTQTSASASGAPLFSDVCGNCAKKKSSQKKKRKPFRHLDVVEPVAVAVGQTQRYSDPERYPRCTWAQLAFLRPSAAIHF